MKTAEQLDQEILGLIGQRLEHRDDTQFNRLALDLFEYQFAHNQPYQNFCRRRAAEPSNISSWHEIPAVPTSAFKDAALACFPVERAAVIFETSGTTQSMAKRGRHYLQTTDLYRASIIPNFAAHLLPDGGLPPLLILTPPPEDAPHSSLSFMMGVVAEEFGRRGSNYFIRDGQLEARRLADALQMAEGFGEPVMLLGTAFAFVHFFEWCEAHQQSFRLPQGSRAMETGGFKGKSREMPKEELWQMFEDYLLLSSDRIVNEYGMTELGTQFYDVTLKDRQSATPKHSGLANTFGVGNRQSKFVPPWSRVEIVDPATGKEVGVEERGLIRIFDLTNRNSVMAIQTEDIGIRCEDGFEVIGRAMGAEARGCSIAADEFLAANSLR